MAVGDVDIDPLIMESLTQNAVVGFGDSQASNGQIAHLIFILTADKYLCHRPISAHVQPGDSAIAAAHVEGNVVQARRTAADNLAAFL